MHFGLVNRARLIFESTYRTEFETKRVDLNLNYWVAREVNWAGPLCTAHAGWLSGCPHSSVRQRGAKQYGGCGPHDQALILQMRFIVHARQGRRERTLALPVGAWEDNRGS